MRVRPWNRVPGASEGLRDGKQWRCFWAINCVVMELWPWSKLQSWSLWCCGARCAISGRKNEWLGANFERMWIFHAFLSETVSKMRLRRIENIFPLRIFSNTSNTILNQKLRPKNLSRGTLLKGYMVLHIALNTYAITTTKSSEFLGYESRHIELNEPKISLPNSIWKCCNLWGSIPTLAT